MTFLQPVHEIKLHYGRIVGTGGIGSGMFFLLKGNQTLGRNESRMATVLPCKDFCKQHIILHYLAVLLSSKTSDFEVMPIGKVGNDRAGKELIDMMKGVGMDTTNVSVSSDQSTLFSVCYQYPDNSGGNLTTENSACNSVSPDYITQALSGRKGESKKEIFLSVPEVPVAARIALLQHGRERRSLNVASVSSSEIDEFKEQGGFGLVDFLFINIDEAKNIAGILAEDVKSKDVVDGCIETLLKINDQIVVLITEGANGSYCYAGNLIEYTPALKVEVKSTAGAGDAFLAGTIAGLCCGLSLTKGMNDHFFAETPINSAVELGTLLASLSVTSQDTIHPAANASLLYTFAKEHGVVFGEEFLKIFRDSVVGKADK